MRRVLAIVVAGGLAACSPLGAEPRALEHADVGGVRIGMTAAEATAALRARFPAARFSHGLAYCAGDYAQLLKSRSLGKAAPFGCVTSIVADGDESVVVSLIEDYPAHPRTMRVYAVRYDRSDTRTSADAAAFADALRRRYGRPTASGAGVDAWGATPPSAPPQYLPTTDAFALLDERDAGSPGGVSLLAWRTRNAVGPGGDVASIELTDMTFARERDAAIRAAYAAVVPKTAPAFSF